MINVLARALVILGTAILTAAMLPVYWLMIQLPPGLMRRRWIMLTGLIALFIAGYISYAIVFWDRHNTLPDLIGPAVFFFGAGFVWLTVTLANQTAVDVRRVTLLEQESVTDPLMGIYNRRYLDRRLEEEFERAHRHTVPLSVLLVDIDHFKDVNDRYGHSAGDLVLSYIGKLILNAVRHSDIAARYGGDELLIIAPNTNESAAAILAERIRQHVDSHELVLAGEPGQRQTIRVTVSIGVAVLDTEAENFQTLICKADTALYRAKQGGRNCVVVGKSCE
jgi:diguanylate cyclase (GGDEF)-like protein